MIRPVLFAFLALIAFLPAAQAQGLEVGKTIPALTAQDQNGKEQSFDTLKGAKGLTLVFIRSVEWCPFCQRQVMDLSENAAKFKDAGYPVVTVSYDSTDKLKQFATKFKTDIPMLSDPRSDLIKAFGVFNDNYAKGTLAYGTPFPGVYVVSADKTVKAKFFKEGVQDRPTVDELLASMKEAAPMDPAVEFPQEETAPVTDAAPPVMDTPSADPSLSLENAPVETPAAPAAEATVPVAPEAPAPVMDSALEPVAPAAPDMATPAPAAPQDSAVPADDTATEFIPPSEEEAPADDSAGTGAPSGL